MNSGPSRTTAPEMFDTISKTYDLLNHLLSLGQDFYWRNVLARKVPKTAQRILDCATGTRMRYLSSPAFSMP
jgi:demethylmenaquinone methyltransferase / 2-methoxy-6-polyprenyl-1,4-benzoquinol methylase